MAQTIALTGGSGFVGRHVLAELLKRDVHVKLLMRDLGRAPRHPNITVVHGDLSNSKALADLCAGTDVVLHLAGTISAVDDRDYFDVNVDGTRRMLDSAKLHGVRRFVFLSSLAAREPQLSPYAASKRDAEALVLKGRHLETQVLRPPAVYGEGDLATLPLIKALLSGTAVLPGRRNQRFSLIHAADLANVCCDAVFASDTGIREVDDGAGGYGWEDLRSATHRLYGTPHRMVFLPQWLAMALGHAGDCIAGHLGKPIMVNSGKMSELYHPDWVARGSSLLPQHRTSLLDGLRRTVSWAASEGLLPRPPEVDRSAHNQK